MKFTPTFTPQTDISRTLFNTVPRKVYNWLMNLGIDVKQVTSHEGLSWEFSTDGGTSYLLLNQANYNTDDTVCSWSVSPNAPENISGSHRNFEFIEYNLEWFVEYERRVYLNLELLQDKVINERKVNA